ncbi:aldehyde dehydrogenase family protein [Pseudoteredinibacter isoporae]|uniref:Aldehyde dehydrogenase (NAD+) n=1 Tax=Pseudoteredinibacter isoporae TaxID=570281 RepID=A0A7X0JVH4_9GAMM|nr:aldehyde dehydrogenase family protein [Pseudoteredinibacter isoporae]MBB6522922.1 aldehyde dehydrogenase (NAD+) [Pseudoteredinibacter isoporae]NHO88448.1 aldehyde dehydrogenase family protein [Pseudoteredinibacter isoporae]NIB23221.1 aldehyde dehydrogenase family protein [Pseudoteredinibacter isoporae]
MSKLHDKFYINGQWQNAKGQGRHDVIHPATEEVVATVALGNQDDVDAAISAARAAFDSWSTSSAEFRAELIRKAAARLRERREELVTAVSQSMGCPPHITPWLQIDGPVSAFEGYADRCVDMEKVREVNNSLVVKEAAGVCAFINPWNYPLNQLMGKIAPALAAGCTMVVKPSEQTPLQDIIVAEVLDEVGFPAGVFNLVIGLGHEVGAALSSHPEVDVVSFTGSTRAGILVAEAAAPTVKRVTQELGGKSAFIITEDADLDAAVRCGVDDVMINTGQTCTALTRMLVPASRYEEATQIAKAHTESLTVGYDNEEVYVGPMSSARQRDTVQRYIEIGMEEATLLTGGLGAPEGLEKGFYVKPTIFSDANNDMRIAREEIFGPVLVMIPYQDLEDAVAIANDTPYGLSSGVYAKTKEDGIAIARRMRAGQCYVNGGGFNYDAPFGGYKQSGNGREWGDEGLHEFVETKAIQL